MDDNSLDVDPVTLNLKLIFSGEYAIMVESIVDSIHSVFDLNCHNA